MTFQSLKSYFNPVHELISTVEIVLRPNAKSIHGIDIFFDAGNFQKN